MNVLLINGSPNTQGCTFTALSEVAQQLEADGVQTKIVHIGKEAIHGCIACRKCKTTGRCVFNDIASEFADLMAEADGLIVGSPVYYAGPNGTLCALLDRMFYSSAGKFSHKPAAAVVSCRRGGSTASLDRLNKYFGINQMPVVSSQYWNMVHGATPEDVRKDEEGLQIMRTLGKNMAWLIKALQGVQRPVPEETRKWTNFIR